MVTKPRNERLEYNQRIEAAFTTLGITMKGVKRRIFLKHTEHESVDTMACLDLFRVAVHLEARVKDVERGVSREPIVSDAQAAMWLE